MAPVYSGLTCKNTRRIHTKLKTNPKQFRQNYELNNKRTNSDRR